MLTIIVDADVCPRSCMATLKRLKGSWGIVCLPSHR